MSRHGYSDDLETQDLAMWRGRVMSAIRGKRGQALLREMRDALDAMPDKRLVSSELEVGGEVCAIGSVFRSRQIDMRPLDPSDHDGLGALVNISPCMVQEIEWQNDEAAPGDPEKRWEYMRRWCDKHLSPHPTPRRSKSK